MILRLPLPTLPSARRLRAMPTAGDSGSVTSSRTHVGGKSRGVELNISPQEQLAVPDDKIEETDDWERSPNNPRNWSPLKKWTATAIVSIYLSFPSFL